MIRVGHLAVAHGSRALRRFDEAVLVLEALAARDAETVEQAEKDQRGEALRRRRQVEERRAANGERERLHRFRLMAPQVLARDDASRRLHVGRDLDRNVAAIEIVVARMGDLPERIGEPRLPEDRALRRGLAVGEEMRGEIRLVPELVDMSGGDRVERPRHRHAVLRPADRVGEQVRARHAPARARSAS